MMSRNIAEITGKMPFAGKYLVKNLYQRGREASRNGETVGKLSNAAVLGAFAVAHVSQISLGIVELSHDVGQNPALITIDALYVAANAMAAYTQAYLAARVLSTRKEGMNTVGEIGEGGANRPKQFPIEVQPKQLAVDAAVTFGGQALFLTTMH